MKKIEEILSKAKQYIKETGDDKVWCDPDELKLLLSAGATPLKINNKQVSGKYSHRIYYEGIVFTNTTDDQISYKND